MVQYQKTIKQRSPLLALPYEIRHPIYSTLYPIGHEIIVAGTGLTQITDRHGPLKPVWADPTYETNLLLACQMINEEITTMYYGRNAFSAYPEAKKACSPPARCEQFLAQLRPETAVKIKNLHIFLGPCIDESFVGALAPSMARFHHLEVSITRFRLLPEIFAQERRILVAQACRLIAGARCGAETIWDTKGEKDSMEMLDSIMPDGYQRKT